MNFSSKGPAAKKDHRFRVDLSTIKTAYAKNITHQQVKVVSGKFCPYIETSSIQAFTQAVGYFKFKYKESFTILYRGQRMDYGSLRPSIYRGISTEPAIQGRNKSIKDLLLAVGHNKLFLEGVPEYAMEPILQHYGINTRWLDLVDNHWIALWFSLHRFLETKDGMNIHCEARNVDDDDGFAYIVLVAAPRLWGNIRMPGIFEDTDATLVDLRICAPSIYLRPHSQHAYLMRRSSVNKAEETDLSNRVVGIVRIPIRVGRAWLGVGGLISANTLFPPPYYDTGYHRLLERRPEITRELSTIKYFYPSND